jgi:hypothetical protein
MSAERAAKRMINACRKGQPVVTVGLPAKAARTIQGLFPNFTVRALALVNRLLPHRPDSSTLAFREKRAVSGQVYRKAQATRIFRGLGTRAAKRFNELKVG